MKAGEIIGGRYRVERLLASGGMGAVYVARHTMSDRVVALKLISTVGAMGALDETTVRRFKREATAPAAIGHPGIVDVVDAGVDTDRGTLFLAMELLEGESLRERFRRPGLPRSEALAWIRALLDPLAAAHAKDFVHRDLKPENAMVVKTDQGERIKLLDFGLARTVRGPSSTLTGSTLGTPAYMAPEQAMSAKGVTAAADVWAVGVMLYEALAGRPPFRGETPHATIMAACSSPHPPLENVPAELAALVDTCLSKNPDERPADADALRRRLDPLLDDVSGVVHVDRGELETAPTVASVPVLERAPRPVLFGVALVVAAAGVAAGLWFRSSGEQPPRVGAQSGRAQPETQLETQSETQLETQSETDPDTEPEAQPDRSANAMRTVEGDGFRMQVPETWLDVESSVPTLKGSWSAPEPDGQSKPSAYVVIEPFDGDTQAYVSLGLDNMSAVATIHMQRDSSIGPIPAVQVDATFHGVDPPHRGITRAAVRGGTGYVIGCRADVDRFADYQRLCRSILDSFEPR